MNISYFLGANSKDGFRSLYSGFCAAPGDYLSVIKGGPGTGKSGFMRKIGAEAERRGLGTEYVLCSGDPDSLDGVYIPALRRGWVDGTAPHTADPAHFAVDGDYVNLGAFCSPLDGEHADNAMRLYGEYKAEYAAAYGYLASAAAARAAYLPPLWGAEQLAALAQTPASWFDEPALLDALSKLPHYDETRAQRYLAYRTGGAWTLEQVLRIVNTDNDLPRFTAAVDADPDDGDLILVNKYSRLASDYVPEDLVTVEPAYSNGGKLKSEVNDAFCDLVEAMWAETGLHLVNASPYRSYQTQKNLYARYRTQYSEATTDRFSARAGYSEHQTGLALDVIAPGGTLNGFKNTQQFVWMRDNAHRFGFILRYGDGMEYITGYKFEPWHYRYVGVEAATFIYENDLTFEEYYAYYVKK